MISIKDIAFAFPGISVLRGLNLEISAGEHVVLAGPSGCGKTTLLRLLAGIETPQRGSIAIGGEKAAADGRNLLPPASRGVSMVFQDLGLWPHVSVRGHIQLALAASHLRRAETRKKVGEILDQCRLGDLQRARPGQLSGGQQQRLALARALVVRPRVLLLDEPFASLDLALRQVFFELLAKLRAASQPTIVTVTHHPADALEMRADRIAVLEGGVIAEVASPGDLGANAACSETARAWRRFREASHLPPLAM